MWPRRRREPEPEPEPVVKAAEQTVEQVADRLAELAATYQKAQELMAVMDERFPTPHPGRKP